MEGCWVKGVLLLTLRCICEATTGVPVRYHFQTAAWALSAVSPHSNYYSMYRWKRKPVSTQQAVPGLARQDSGTQVLCMDLACDVSLFCHCRRGGSSGFSLGLRSPICFSLEKDSLPCPGISGVGQKWQVLEKRGSLGEGQVRVYTLLAFGTRSRVCSTPALTEAELLPCYEERLWLSCSC